MTAVTTSSVEGEPLQRLVEWSLPQQSAPIASFLVTCISSDDIVSDIRTVEVLGATVTQVVIGNGQGMNQPLPLGAQYSCSVVSRNAAGDSGPTVSAPFTVASIINSETKQVYLTIQDAIDGASESQSISVGRGEYREHVIIDKSINLIGPNADIVPYNSDRSGFNPMRQPEAIIMAPSEVTEYFLTLITEPDVVVGGFSFLLPQSGFLDTGIIAFSETGNVNGLRVKNNIVSGFEELTDYGPVGVLVSLSSCDQNEGNTNVEVFQNMVLDSAAEAFYLQCTSGTVENNVALNVRAGVQIQPYNFESNGKVSGNTFSVYERGIYLNFWDGPSEPGLWEVSENRVLGVPQSFEIFRNVWNGLRFETILGTLTFSSPFLDVSRNVIDVGSADLDTISNVFFIDYKLQIQQSLILQNNEFIGKGTFIDALSGQNDNANDLIDTNAASSIQMNNEFSEETEITDQPCCTIVANS